MTGSGHNSAPYSIDETDFHMQENKKIARNISLMHACTQTNNKESIMNENDNLYTGTYSWLQI